MQAVSAITEFPSFSKRAYPCWVMSLTNIATFDELPAHEECIENLEELLPDSTSPSCAYSFFISQNWEGGRAGPSGQGFFNVRGYPHPDNKLNTKLRWLTRCFLFAAIRRVVAVLTVFSPHITPPPPLRRIKQHMKLPQGRQIWLWFDIISIPQRSRDLQLVAIGSLCAYTQLCTRWVTHSAPGHCGPII